LQFYIFILIANPELGLSVNSIGSEGTYLPRKLTAVEVNKIEIDSKKEKSNSINGGGDVYKDKEEDPWS
jgi:hypothetical protein